MRKISYYLITCILMICLFSFIVSANTYCSQESCSNIFFLDSYVGVGSASFTPAYTTARAYSSCATENTLYNPVAGDINEDGINEIIVTPSLTKISIYGANCALVNSITSIDPITSPPVLIPYYSGGRQSFDIAVLTNFSLNIYNGSTLNLSTETNYSLAMRGNLTNMGCDSHYCFAKNFSSNSSAIFRLYCDYNICYLTPNVTVYSKNLPTLGNIKMPTSQAITVYTDTVNKVSRAGSWCQSKSGDLLTMDCFRMDSNGVLYNNALAGLSFNINSIEYVQSFYAKTGSVIRYFLTAFYTKATSGASIDSVVYDTSNNLIFDAATNIGHFAEVSSANRFSGWMVGNYDKGGNTQACVITARNETICYNNGYFGNTVYNFTINPFPVNETALPFMADFNVSDAYMGIATAEGIFYIAPDGTNKTIKRTGYNGYYAASNPSTKPVISVLDSNSQSITPVFHFVGLPEVFYADSSKSTLLYSGFSLTCGNGICEAGELFTCPSDCGAVVISYPVNCTTDAQCPPAYSKCLAQKCVSGYNGMTCGSNDDCPFNQSVCYNNYCVAGVSGLFNSSAGFNRPETVNSANVGQLIDNFISSLFMGSTLLRFIVGLCLLLFFTLKYNKEFNKHNSQLLVIIIFSIFLILFTFIGLIDKWVIMALVIVCLTLIATVFILRFKPSEG